MNFTANASYSSSTSWCHAVDLRSWSQLAELLICSSPQILRDDVYILFISFLILREIPVLYRLQEDRLQNCKLTSVKLFLHWMKHKAVQNFHTIFAVVLLFFEALVQIVFAGMWSRVFKASCLQRQRGGRWKVLWLNYIACGKRQRGRWQMTNVEEQSRAGGVEVCSEVTALKKGGKGTLLNVLCWCTMFYFLRML